MKFKVLIYSQGVYTLLTAVWPLVDIQSFMRVTGPKTDIWLVKTVGAILIPISITLMSYAWIKTDKRPALLLGMLTCISFIVIDFYYASADVISDIYMLDGLLEIGFLIYWIIIARTLSQER